MTGKTPETEIPATPGERDRQMFLAALGGDCARLEQLLRAGADPNTKNTRENYGMLVSPLYAAVEAGRTDAAKLLVLYGAKLDSGTTEGRTPLMAAVAGGRADIAAFLIDKGAKTQLKYGPETLLDMAEASPKPNAMLTLLLKAMNENTLRDAFFDAARKGRAATLEAALDLGVDANAADPTGNTALILLAQHTEKPAQAAEALRLLLTRGAQLDAENDLRETALSAAMMRRPVPAETVLLLVEAGADITRDTLAGITVYEAAQLAGNERLLPCFESARKQNILREVKKYYEGTGNRITIRKPLNPRPPQ